MTHARVLRAVLLVAMLLVVAVLACPTLGQETVITETFDDPTLPGWEHSPNTTVVDGVLRQSLLADHLNGSHRRCASHGVAPIRPPMGAGRPSLHQGERRSDAAQREARGHALGHDQDVGHEFPMLTGKESPRSCEAALHLFGYEDYAMLVTEAT